MCTMMCPDVETTSPTLYKQKETLLAEYFKQNLMVGQNYQQCGLISELRASYSEGGVGKY